LGFLINHFKIYLFIAFYKGRIYYFLSPKIVSLITLWNFMQVLGNFAQRTISPRHALIVAPTIAPSRIQVRRFCISGDTIFMVGLGIIATHSEAGMFLRSVATPKDPKVQARIGRLTGFAVALFGAGVVISDDMKKDMRRRAAEQASGSSTNALLDAVDRTSGLPQGALGSNIDPDPEALHNASLASDIDADRFGKAHKPATNQVSRPDFEDPAAFSEESSEYE